MRILLLTQFYPPIVGGEERHVRNLGIALSHKGHHVAVVTQWYPGAVDYEMDGEVGVYRIRGTLQRLSGLFVESERRHAPPFPDPELVTEMRRIVKAERPNVVHAHNWLVASFLPLKKWSDAGLVVTLHDYSRVCAKKNLMHDGAVCTGPSLSQCLPCAKGHYKSAAKAAVTTLGNFASARLARSRVDRYIAVSHAVARDNGLHDLPHEVIHNFVPDDVSVLSSDIDPCVEQLPANGFILFVGDVMNLKGANVLLKAYADLKNAPPLVLIGRRTPDTPAELPPNVHLFSTWPHSAIMHAWSRCRFGVLPSVGPEACATVVMEAMACGKPVVASDIGGMPDLIDNRSTGLLVPPGDVTGLRDAMQLLIDNPVMVEHMGCASLSRVERLKASTVVSQIERVYQTVGHHV